MEKRARNACWKCKERRIKCTLERPVCGNCARAKHKCQYGLKLLWREEAQARGICFGRQGVYGRSSSTTHSTHSPALDPYKGHFHFFNASTGDFLGDGSLPSSVSEPEEQQHIASLALTEETRDETAIEDGARDTLSLPLDLPGLFSGLVHVPYSIEPLGLHLFDFYIHTMCPMLTISSIENPYLEFIAPLSLTSQPLYHSILSWSARELYLKNPTNWQYSQLSVQHRVQALRGLRKEIQTAQNDVASASGILSSILATIIILSCHEIVETCSSAWIAHLKAARMLCSILWPDRHDALDRFRRFCIMWFVSHEIMSRTAWIQDTLFDPSEWFAGDDDTEIDVMIGCSRGLIHQVSEISLLIKDTRKVSTSKVDNTSIFRRRDSIESALLRLDQSISAANGSIAQDLLDIAESKRLCALIYLYACVDNATPSSPAIQTLTTRVLQLVAKLPPKPSLTFPMFVVGTLGVWNEEDRRSVLDKFTSMIEDRPLASIVRAKEIVKAVWLDRDLGKCGRWENLVERRGKLLSLA